VEAPRVTIVDPARPDWTPTDVVGDDDDAPRSRRGAAALLALAVLLLGWLGVDDLRERRAAAAEERRLQAVVELELTTHSSGGNETRGADDVAEVVRQVGLRNTGPRPVEVLSASYGTLTLEGTRRAEPGRHLTVTLSRRLSCAQRPAEEPVEQAVRLQVRAADGTVVERELPLPAELWLSDPALLQRACGYLEPYEGGMAIATGTARLEGDALLLDLLVGNHSRAPLELAHVAGGAAWRCPWTPSTDGRPACRWLCRPARAPAPGTVPMLAVTATLRVQDCSAVVAPDLDGQLYDESSAAIITTAFARPGTAPDLGYRSGTQLQEPQVVADLLRLSCG
jgi:hypothetical protein